MTELFAQPYDISAQDFYFQTPEAYQEKSAKSRNDFGFPVEEYEIQFIDGEAIDAQLFEALGVNQCNFPQFLEACDAWDDHQKKKVIVAVGQCGYSFDLKSGDPDDVDVDDNGIVQTITAQVQDGRVIAASSATVRSRPSSFELPPGLQCGPILQG
jgi:hypothetical protein